jgi:DNA-binding transcriptional MerR regulator
MSDDQNLVAAIERQLLSSKKVLTTGEMAKMLGLPGPWTVRRLEGRGVIPPARRSLVHGDRLYDSAALVLLRKLASMENKE